MEEMLHRP